MNGIVRLLAVAGAVGLVWSGVWWYATYSRIAEFLGATSLPIECLWGMGGACGAVTSAANMIGANAYDPRLFWASAACLVIGVILIAFQSGGRDDDDYDPRHERGRRDPHM